MVWFSAARCSHLMTLKTTFAGSTLRDSVIVDLGSVGGDGRGRRELSSPQVTLVQSRGPHTSASSSIMRRNFSKCRFLGSTLPKLLIVGLERSLRI